MLLTIMNNYILFKRELKKLGDYMFLDKNKIMNNHLLSENMLEWLRDTNTKLWITTYWKWKPVGMLEIQTQSYE